MKHLPRALAIALALALFAALAATPSTRAATTGNVDVTANITTFTTSLSLSICDTSADFGSGLDAFGNAPTGTADAVQGIPDAAGAPDGALYQWSPSCAAGASFLTVDSNVNWQGSVCATAGTITASGLTLDDLTHSMGTFSECTAPTVWSIGGPGLSNIGDNYFLRVDAGDGEGSFAATTTWDVTAG